MAASKPQVLALEHLDEVLDVLKCGFDDTKWLRLGLKLGLLKTTLDAIEKEHRGDVDRCLMECLSKWIRRADNVDSKGGPPTWDSLSAALRAIEEIAAASKLDAEKQCAPLLKKNEEEKTNGKISSISEPKLETMHEKTTQVLQFDEQKMCKFQLHCKDPETDVLMSKKFKVQGNISLKSALEEACKLMEISLPPNCCRLVKYSNGILKKSYDDGSQEKIFAELVGGVKELYSFDLFLETRSKNDEHFVKYNEDGLQLEVSVIDKETCEIRVPSQSMRAEQRWSVKQLKIAIGKKFNLDHAHMHLVYRTDETTVQQLFNDDATLKDEGLRGKYELFASELADCQKMCGIVDFQINSVLLTISLPPCHQMPDFQIVKREIQVRVDQRMKFANLKQNLVPYIEDLVNDDKEFRVYSVLDNMQEDELISYNATISQLCLSESKFMLKVMLGKALQPGERRIKLYLLRVKEPEFSTFMMETILNAEYTPVKKFKKQIIEEAKKLGIKYEFDENKMRLRKKNKYNESPENIYLDGQRFNKDITLPEDYELYMYIEQLEVPDTMETTSHIQVYVRRWQQPGKCDPIEEVVLDGPSVKNFKEKLMHLSGIPADKIAMGKRKRLFSAEISCCEIKEDELNWKIDSANNVGRCGPNYINCDGSIIYYKDCRE